LHGEVEELSSIPAPERLSAAGNRDLWPLRELRKLRHVHLEPSRFIRVERHPLAVLGELRQFAELAWQHSPAFRDQCRKLAAGGAAMIIEPVARPDMWRALTQIGRLPDGTTMARARVRPSEHTVELIAHELEHVLEYVEGFQFLMEARRGNSRVSLIGGAYETGRAIDAGRRVAQEVRDAMTRTESARAGYWCRARAAFGAGSPWVHAVRLYARA
jgi:hypothetical protein